MTRRQRLANYIPDRLMSVPRLRPIDPDEWQAGEYIPKDLFPEPVGAETPPDRPAERLARSAEIRLGVRTYLARVRGVSE